MKTNSKKKYRSKQRTGKVINRAATEIADSNQESKYMMHFTKRFFFCKSEFSTKIKLLYVGKRLSIQPKHKSKLEASEIKLRKIAGKITFNHVGNNNKISIKPSTDNVQSCFSSPLFFIAE